jgi:hypothetical protein
MRCDTNVQRRGANSHFRTSQVLGSNLHSPKFSDLLGPNLTLEVTNRSLETGDTNLQRRGARRPFRTSQVLSSNLPTSKILKQK